MPDAEKITKTFRFDPSMVTCLNCQCNYPMSEDAESRKFGTWCQVWSHPVVPQNTEENQGRAKKCKQWIPREINRSTCEGEEPNPDRWYEKDSLG